MSFTDEYYALKNKNKKKKKEEETTTEKKTNKSEDFSSEYFALKNSDTKQAGNDDIAPLYTNKTSKFFNTDFTNRERTTVTAKAEDDYNKKRQEEKENPTWFKEGEGKWWQKVLGSIEDIGENIGAGVAGMGEKVVDALAFVGNSMAHSQNMQNAQNEMIYGTLTGDKNMAETALDRWTEVSEKQKQSTADFIAKDLYDEEAVAKQIISYSALGRANKQLGVDSEASSVFGEKSDQLAQSAGQLAGTIGLQAVGVPWYLTTGVSTFGAEAEGALRNGATLEEAGLSAAISAGAEIITEKIGGIAFGGNTLTDTAIDALAKGVTNKLARALIGVGKVALNATAEGFEEVVSGYASAFGQKLTYMSDKEINELFTNEDKLDSFIGGFVLGGVGEVGAVGKSAITGTDYVTGYTKTEQQVVDKLVENRIEEAQKDGEKLTTKEKKAIGKEVENALKNGEISVDTIEEILGGETYKNYKSAIEEETALKTEFDTLNKMKQFDMTGEQIDRRNELKQKLEELKNNSNSAQLKTQLGDEVLGLVKDSKLLTESYNERARRGQAFEADLTQYDAKQQAVIKNAIDSGILNNTNRTHRFVDLISKISADKGVLFDFTDNKKLNDSGFAIEGKTVNGYVTKDGITLNIDSNKALNSVVGHEITHVLEGTELYTELQNVMFDYAKSKGDYQGRYEALTELYKNIKDANVDAELTADLVGDYLFTDSDFVNHLYAGNRNIFQKIYDEVKYLYKVATAGSKEARELERVKRAFDKAYKEAGNAQVEADTKYSISDSDGKQLTKGQQEYFKDSKMRDDNGNLKVMYHGSQDAGFHIFDAKMSDDDTSFFFVDRNDVAASYSGTSETYEAKTIRTAEDMNSFLAEIGYDQYEAVEQNGKFELLENNEHVAYSDTAQGLYKEFCWYEGVGEGDANYKVYLNLTNPLVVDAEGRNWNNISREFSQEVADRYNSLTTEEKQALTDLAGWGEYGTFKDEMLEARAIAGNSLLASAYEKLGGANANLYDAFTIASDNFSEDSIKEFAVKQMNTRDYAKKAKAEGYDGVIFKNIHDNGGYSNGSEGASTVAIAFDSNQIKSVANEKPTTDKDIRFSLSESVEETKDLVAVHNLSEEKLIKSLKLGGLPMPSIAIARAKEGHSDFGTISLVFSKDTINPTNRQNKVYSGDAWTPTYPRVEYEVSDKAQEKIEEKINGLIPENVARDLGGLHIDTDNLTSDLNRFGGNIADAFRYNTALKYAFLVDSGNNLELPTKNKPLAKFSNHEDGAIIRIAETVSEDKLRGILREYSSDQVYEVEPEIRKALNEYLQEKYSNLPIEAREALMRTDTMSRGDLDSYAEEALNYLKNGIEQGVDYRSARALIDEAVDTQAYEDWVNNLFADIVQSEGIRNNKDLFTPSGNRRSFGALHYEHNLENVIKAMKEQGAKGVGAFGGGNIFGASTTEYGSISEIKEDANNRMKRMSADEYDAIRKEFRDRFYDIAYSLPIHKDSFSAVDDASNMLVEAVSKFKTRSGMANYLRNESKGWANYSEHIVDDLIELVNDIRNMPTGYFEAKPQRAVGFDEVATAIIPNNASAELKAMLDDNGIKYVEYESGNEQARTDALNSLEDAKFSLSQQGEQFAPIGNFNVYGKDVRKATEAEVTPEAPIAEATDGANAVDTSYEDNYYAPVSVEEANAQARESLASLNDADAPIEQSNAQYGEGLRDNTSIDALALNQLTREIATELNIGDRKRLDKEALSKIIQDYSTGKIKSFTDLYGEVARRFGDNGGELVNERLRDAKEYLRTTPIYASPLVKSEVGVKEWGNFYRSNFKKVKFTTDQQKGLGVDSVYMELQDLYPDLFPDSLWSVGDQIMRIVEVANMDETMQEPLPYEVLQEATTLIHEAVTDYHETEAMMLADEMASLPIDESLAPPATEDISPTPIKETAGGATAENAADNFTPIKEATKQTEAKPNNEGKTAKVLTDEPAIDRNKRSAWGVFKNNVLDKGMIFEDLSLKTGNRELQAKWNSIRYAEGKAQRLIGEGNENVSSLKSIRETVENSGKTQQFYDYLYHKHNVDRMSLEEKAKSTIWALRGKFGNLKDTQIKAIAAKEITDKTTEKTANTVREAREYLQAMKAKNKPVFGDSITADISRATAAKLEKANPEFKQWADEVYTYNKYLRELLVEGGVISKETAELWERMYPYFVPIRRSGDTGLNINVPLDTGRTGVNAPIKRATGGNRDILPLFDTMALRTEQTYKAIAKNRFGVELKNTLGTTVENVKTNLDEVIDSIDTQDGLLQEGKNGNNPTFTVFENGEKVTFEITEEMYDAMKPTSKGLSYTNKVANTASNIFRGLLTEYSPVFMATNALKDAQDVLINSQHATKTYTTIPKAIAQMVSNGRWYQEYLANGGADNTYFDGKTNTFKPEDKSIEKLIGMPLNAIRTANNFIERIPRLAEYIASREAGRSIDVSMLDAARVTTNFAAGGDLTKMLNRNGVTFLNASMQGAIQQVRNVREAKANGLKGWVQLATKVMLAGLPAMLLNDLLWDDDEEYEELSDYVKQNYYIVGKFGDGKFVRIPKGRTLAVIQNAFEQMRNLITGDDEADLATFLNLAVSNLAPNNPIDNNIISPFVQVANNETWYGEDLVPTRLQDLPASEQYDESTDAISKWLGEKLNVISEWLGKKPNVSPYKINYLLNQYSGGIGDVFLPMMTPEAESGDNSLAGNLLAPWKDKFTTDSVMNNQYVSDFYDTMDELTTNAKSGRATDVDVLKYKYINSVNAELGELYAKKREIQNSDLTDAEKYYSVREVQKQIDELAKESLGTYEDVNINGNYATVGDRHYKLNDEGEWEKINDKRLEKQNNVTSELGISASDYWSNKEEYDYAYDNPENYAVAKSVGGYKAYRTYSKQIGEIRDNNDSSSGIKDKDLVTDYIFNELDLDYGQKIILYRSLYSSKDDKATYNMDIIDYLNSREDISYEEMETILKKLGFTVGKDGTITWD